MAPSSSLSEAWFTKKKPVVPLMHCQETQLLSARTDWKKKPTPKLMPCLASLTSTLRGSSFWLNSEVSLWSWEGYLCHFAHVVISHMPLKCPLSQSLTHNGKHPLPKFFDEQQHDPKEIQVSRHLTKVFNSSIWREGRKRKWTTEFQPSSSLSCMLTAPT